MKLETDLHRAQSLGSAKSGLHHWIIQRITALALIPLGIWCVIAFIVFLSAPYKDVRLWLSSSMVVTVLILFTGFMFYHGYLGMRVIWEDYVPNTSTKWFLVITTKIVSIFMAILGIVCILKIFLS